MAKVKEQEVVEGSPQLDATDINILYTLALQSTIKVSDAPSVAVVLEKCKTILETINQKVNG